MMHKYIPDILGEYLVEMTWNARINIPIDFFADLLTRFIPGTRYHFGSRFCRFDQRYAKWCDTMFDSYANIVHDLKLCG